MARGGLEDLSSRLDEAIILWRAVYGSLTSCIRAVDAVIATHPRLPALLMELQATRAAAVDLVMQLVDLQAQLASGRFQPGGSSAG